MSSTFNYLNSPFVSPSRPPSSPPGSAAPSAIGNNAPSAAGSNAAPGAPKQRKPRQRRAQITTTVPLPTTEPPAPPPETQIDSSALPIRNPLPRENSVSSSVKVAPPASRLSPATTPRPFTPDTSTESPASQKADDPFALSAADEEQESVRQTLPRGETLERIGTLPGAFPGSRSETPAPSGVNPAAIVVGAGAATLAAGAGIAAAVDSQSKQAEPPTETKDNFDDFFGPVATEGEGGEQPSIPHRDSTFDGLQDLADFNVDEFTAGDGGGDGGDFEFDFLKD